MNKNVKVVFMGTPDFAVPTLKKLIEQTDVVLVVTQPDKEVGRKHEIKISPVKEVAIENNIKIFQPLRIREDFAIIKNLKPDLIVTCAYGQILPQELLDIPHLGCINVHASLLPKYRGSAPIQYALLNGDKETGITLMYMNAGMDTGDIIVQEKYQIKKSDTSGILHDILADIGANLLAKNLDNIVNGNVKRIKQDSAKATIAPRIIREDEMLNLNEKGEKIINKIRALNPWPLAYLKYENLDFKVIEAEFVNKPNTIVGQIQMEKDKLGIEVENGIIYFKKIKPIGKNIMDIKAYLNGVKNGK